MLIKLRKDSIEKSEKDNGITLVALVITVIIIIVVVVIVIVIIVLTKLYINKKRGFLF